MSNDKIYHAIVNYHTVSNWFDKIFMIIMVMFCIYTLMVNPYFSIIPVIDKTVHIYDRIDAVICTILHIVTFKYICQGQQKYYFTSKQMDMIVNSSHKLYNLIIVPFVLISFNIIHNLLPMLSNYVPSFILYLGPLLAEALFNYFGIYLYKTYLVTRKNNAEFMIEYVNNEYKLYHIINNVPVIYK